MARSSDSSILLSIVRDKTFQASEIRRVVALSLLYLVITTVMVGIFYHQILGSLVEGFAPLLFVSEDMQLVNDAVPELAAVLGQWLLAMLVINAILTAVLAIYITRKLGHPLMAIKRTLREIGSGNLDVRLRATDNKNFGEIADELNLALISIREQISAAKSGMAQAEKLSDQAASQQDVDQALGNCRQALDYFQVDAPGSHMGSSANDGDLGGDSNPAAAV